MRAAFVFSAWQQVRRICRFGLHPPRRLYDLHAVSIVCLAHDSPTEQHQLQPQCGLSWGYSSHPTPPPSPAPPYSPPPAHTLTSNDTKWRSCVHRSSAAFVCLRTVYCILCASMSAQTTKMVLVLTKGLLLTPTAIDTTGQLCSSGHSSLNYSEYVHYVPPPSGPTGRVDEILKMADGFSLVKNPSNCHCTCAPGHPK